MKKTLFFLGLFLMFAFVYAQTGNKFTPVAQAYESSVKGGGLLLWDNTNINIVDGQPGGTSTYWSGSNSWTWVADDFDADGPWIIEKVNSKGYYPDASPNHTSTMGIVIYNNANGRPGDEIYRNMNISVADALEPEIVLPQPFQLPEPGKYWITIAAVYDRDATENGHVSTWRWYISRGNTQIGLNYHYYQTHNIFTGYPPGEWLDASVNVSLYSSYFQIIGAPGVDYDCEPVTNIAIEYSNDCSQAEITWKASEEGNFKYIVYRDGIEIATVETEAYTDVAFESTLPHTWGVKVVCEGYTPQVTLFKDKCKDPDCPQTPKNLTITYENGCDAAVLKWFAPTEILWDNYAPASYGNQSYRCLMDAFSRRIIMADDFVVPAGETWHITEVYTGGFYTPSGQPAMSPPDYLGVEIFRDNGSNLPGEQIYENEYLTTISGNVNNDQTIIFPEPFSISEPGKYWVSIYGVYDSQYNEESTAYWVYIHGLTIGSPKCFYQDDTGTWESEAGTYPSMMFRLQGYKVMEDLLYNIYRNGILIAEKVDALDFTDDNFDLSAQHTWAVKLVCTDGSGVSAPALFTLQACSGITEIQAPEFIIYPNPSSSKINISAASDFNKVEVLNLLGQTVISQPNSNNTASLDVSRLNNGVYFVRIVSENGTNVKKFVKQ